MKILASLTLANLKMIFRNRQALFWALAFPVIFVVVFGLFSPGDAPTVTIAVVDHASDPMSSQLIANLQQVETFEVELRQDEETARQELRNGDLSYLLIIPDGLAESVAMGQPATLTLVYDEGNQVSAVVVGVVRRFLDETNLALLQAPRMLDLQPQGISARQLNYFDFLLPGLAAMGVMTFSVIGVASAIALYRQQKILKRILATPLKVRTFFGAMVLAHLVLALMQTVVILAVGVLLFNGHLYGNYLYIGLLMLLANLTFLSIGFIVGAFAKNVEAASGLGNAVSLPMMFLSGTFFPKENLPDALRVVVEYLPLSPLLVAMRGVALEGRPLGLPPGAGRHGCLGGYHGDSGGAGLPLRLSTCAGCNPGCHTVPPCTRSQATRRTR